MEIKLVSLVKPKVFLSRKVSQYIYFASKLNKSLEFNLYFEVRAS